MPKPTRAECIEDAAQALAGCWRRMDERKSGTPHRDGEGFRDAGPTGRRATA